jgi:hypothetical protein
LTRSRRRSVPLRRDACHAEETHHIIVAMGHMGSKRGHTTGSCQWDT